MGIEWNLLAYPKGQPRVAQAERTCLQCGKPLLFRRYRSISHCSMSCAAKTRAASRKKETEPCPICGKPSPWPNKTCSAACGYELRKRNVRPKIHCAVCKIAFYPKMARGLRRKYCSMACYRVKQHRRPAMQTITCLQCGRIFRRTYGAVKRVARAFCNRACFAKFNRGENCSGWRGGHDPNRGLKWIAVAATIRDRDGHICKRCGKAEAENGRKLDVDHIRPWRAFDDKQQANEMLNLVSLCAVCHRQKAKAERAWLRGDVMGMRQYEQAIGLRA